jgi:hypothetical protein
MMFLGRVPALLTRVHASATLRIWFQKASTCKRYAHSFAHALRGIRFGVQRHHAFLKLLSFSLQNEQLQAAAIKLAQTVVNYEMRQGKVRLPYTGPSFPPFDLTIRLEMLSVFAKVPPSAS